jgi:hypothetical protein
MVKFGPSLADRRRLVDLEGNGPQCRDASEVLDLMRRDVPMLNEVRAHAHSRQGPGQLRALEQNFAVNCKKGGVVVVTTRRRRRLRLPGTDLQLTAN